MRVELDRSWIHLIQFNALKSETGRIYIHTYMHGTAKLDTSWTLRL